MKEVLIDIQQELIQAQELVEKAINSLETAPGKPVVVVNEPAPVHEEGSNSPVYKAAMIAMAEHNVPAEYTPSTVSAQMSGRPNLYKQDYKTFLRMLKYFDEDKEPWTRVQWGLRRFGDTRLRKIVTIDGIEYRPRGNQAGPQWYWVAKGVIDTTQKRWLQRVYKEGELTEEEKVANIKKYKGGGQTVAQLLYHYNVHQFGMKRKDEWIK